MEDLRKQLERQINILDVLIKNEKQRLASCKDVEIRHIAISKRKNGYQYYFLDENKKMSYVKKEDLDKVRKILQKEYDEEALENLVELKTQAEKFIKNYDANSIENVYKRRSEARKKLIVPAIIPEENYIANWLTKHEGDRNIFYGDGKYPTEKGDMVRSKSEKILADMFYKYGIPYSYEPVLTLKDGTHAYPDFVLLNVRKRKTIYWEHFGMLNDDGYAKKNWKKISDYEDIGLYPGDNFLFTLEDEKKALNIERARKMIERYLL